MPTIFWSGPYRIFFYSSDGQEPVHVHVERDDRVAKFWISPLKCADRGGFPHSELAKINIILHNNHERIEEAWHDFFGN